MEPVNLLKAKNRDELRQWLEQNHKTEKECWVVVKRGKPKGNNTFWYIDAVEEAMCFGWKPDVLLYPICHQQVLS